MKDGELGEKAVNGNIPEGATKAEVSGNTVTFAGIDPVAVTGFPALIKDNSGKVFQVTSGGAVTHVGTYDSTLSQPDPTVEVSPAKVIFKENAAARFDFDEWKCHGIWMEIKWYRQVAANL